MKTFIGCIIIILAMTGCDITTGDPITEQVTLSWTTPGDDGMIGQATAYDLRYSTELLTEANWDNCPSAECGLIENEPVPGQPYFHQEFTFPLQVELGIDYYFAIKTVDDAGNWSGISNIAIKNWPDDVPPSTITDLSVQ